MEAACRGAREAGGTTLGLLPSARADDANPYVELAVPTGLGDARNQGVPYLDSDLVFAQVGEELGVLGLVLLVGLYLAFAWYSLRLVLSIPDRYEALAAFGLLLCTALQAMLHMQIVSGLAPPKGMTLPFLSDGGTSLLVSCLAVGLALGTVPRSRSAAT